MTAGWDQAKRILAVRLDAMGDVLMTTPALRAVREARPDARITLLTSPAGSAIAGMIPEIDDVIAYGAPWMKAGAAHPVAADLAMIERLRDAAFDGAIVFTVFSQNPLPAAMTCYLAGIPLILAHLRERAYRMVSDAVDDPEPGAAIRHEARRQLDLVAALGWRASDEHLSLAVDPSQREAASKHFAGRRTVLLHPGASAPSRRYPAAAFGEVARLLDGRGMGVIVAAGPGERALAHAIVRAAPTAVVIEPPSLSALAALIAAAPVLIANNSGPAHIAAAVGTPIVSLYAGTNPQHTPWLVPARVLAVPVPCAPCFRSICPASHGRCLADIAPGTVVDAVGDLLENTRVDRHTGHRARPDGGADDSAKVIAR